MKHFYRFRCWSNYFQIFLLLQWGIQKVGYVHSKFPIFDPPLPTPLFVNDFYTVIYAMTIKIFTNSQKNIKLKKMPTPLYAGLGWRQQNFKQLPSNLSERTLFAVWKCSQFFSQWERADRPDHQLPPTFPCSFSFAF